jgi:hypothetical protein
VNNQEHPLARLTHTIRGPVDRLLEEGDRILVMHVPEDDYGRGMAFLLALEEKEVTVLDLNPAMPDVLDIHSDDGPLAAGQIEKLTCKGPCIVLLSGWGSRPSLADYLLKRVAPIVREHPGLRLAVLNNASTIPDHFPGRGPVAWPDADTFVQHVASLAGADRGNIDAWKPD